MIVDIQVGADTDAQPAGLRDWPSTQHPNFAHFARVLGMDINKGEIYIENTLEQRRPSEENSYWIVPLNIFKDAWQNPETAVDLGPINARL